MYMDYRTSLMAQMVNCLPAMWETQVQSLGWDGLLEKETATHSSTLAWRIPRVEEPGRLQSMGSRRVGQDWATSLSLSLLWVGLYGWLVEVPWLGKLVSVFWWVELDFFLECNEVSSNELWDVSAFGVTLGSLYIEAQCRGPAPTGSRGTRRKKGISDWFRER